MGAWSFEGKNAVWLRGEPNLHIRGAKLILTLFIILVLTFSPQVINWDEDTLIRLQLWDIAGESITLSSLSLFLSFSNLIL